MLAGGFPGDASQKANRGSYCQALNRIAVNFFTQAAEDIPGAHARSCGLQFLLRLICQIVDFVNAVVSGGANGVSSGFGSESGDGVATRPGPLSSISRLFESILVMGFVIVLCLVSFLLSLLISGGSRSRLVGDKKVGGRFTRRSNIVRSGIPE